MIDNRRTHTETHTLPRAKNTHKKAHKEAAAGNLVFANKLKLPHTKIFIVVCTHDEAMTGVVCM